MRILFFTKYSREGASSRLRSYQYFPLLEKDGCKVVVKPLFDKTYIANILKGNNSTSKILKSYFKRFLVLFSIHKYDAIVIEKELFPYFTSFFERIITLLGFRYSVIYDDAIFHNYDLNSNKIIRFLFKNKISRVMKYSNCVIAGNEYLKNKAISSGAKKVSIIPTVIDISRYNVIKKESNQKIVIGWIGSPSSFQYLKLIENSLLKIIKNFDVKIHIIGTNQKLNIDDKYIEYIKWSEATEIKELQKFSIGIMPLKDSPWELGKCSYKLIQYMGCGIPVVASPVGMNKEVVVHNQNGFIANNEDEWYKNLKLLVNNIDLRTKMGSYGRNLVENQFSLVNSYKLFKKSITSSSS